MKLLEQHALNNVYLSVPAMLHIIEHLGPPQIPEQAQGEIENFLNLLHNLLERGTVPLVDNALDPAGDRSHLQTVNGHPPDRNTKTGNLDLIGG